MQLHGATHHEVYENFRRDIPDRFNIAECICLTHARGPARDTTALVDVTPNGRNAYTFSALADAAGRLANGLKAQGVRRGDVVAIHLPQGRETLLSHIAVSMLGAIALPIATLFGPDAVRYRLTDSRARALIATAETLEALAPVFGQVDQLMSVIATGLAENLAGPTCAGAAACNFEKLISDASASNTAVDTRADDPALLMYTSGTTGDPKGVLHAGRVLLGHLPGVALPHEMAPQPGDRFWTPADWAWAGGLLNVLFPALAWGLPVVAHRAEKFDPEAAFAFMGAHGVRNTFMPPTALRLMREVSQPWLDNPYNLRSIGTGGEALGEDMIAWGMETFGLTLNEFYGQTEVNLVLGNSSGLFPVRAGSMGRPIPGHRVAVVDPTGEPVPVGEEGVVAVARPDPVMFLEYWGQPDATAAKFRGDWCLLGDIAVRDEDGYFWFRGRDDDVINSAGYRIGPTEVED